MPRPAFQSFCLALPLLVLPLQTHAGDGDGLYIPDTRRHQLFAEAAAQASTPDTLWTFIQNWNAAKSVAWKQPALATPWSWHAKPSVQKKYLDAETIVVEAEIRADAACHQFVQNFPSDPRVWDARLQLLQDEDNSSRSTAEYLAICKQIIAAPDAAMGTHDTARRLLLYRTTEDLPRDPDESLKVFSDYERDYPDDPYGAQLVHDRLTYYTWAKPHEIQPMLKQLLASPNNATAAEAAKQLALRAP